MDYAFNYFFNHAAFTGGLTIDASNESRLIAKYIYLSIPRELEKDLVMTNQYLQRAYAVILNLKYLSALEIRQFITTYLNLQTSLVKLGGNLFLKK